MNKKTRILTILLVAATLAVWYLAFYDASEKSAPNKAFSPYASLARDDTLFAVEMFETDPGTPRAGEVETYEHAKGGVYLLLVPRYAEASIRIEEMEIDLKESKFVPAGVLLETESTGDYALLLRAALPEGGPQLRATVAHGGQSAAYEPTYDGSDDTAYPVVRNGYILWNTIR